MTLLTDLASATEGSRDLDEAFWVATHGPQFAGRIPHYTTNLQDAVDAVPEGEWFCLSGPHNPSGGRYEGGPKSYDVAFLSPIDAQAPTLPLALCIAILRANEAGPEGSRELVSLKQAAEQGIARLRQPNWANLRDYIKIDVVNGRLGPWVHLYSPVNAVLGQMNPQDILWVLDGGSANEARFEPYNGEADPAEGK